MSNKPPLANTGTTSVPPNLAAVSLLYAWQDHAPQTAALSPEGRPVCDFDHNYFYYNGL